MAEQFLRIGGTDGETARALRTNEDGSVTTENTKRNTVISKKQLIIPKNGSDAFSVELNDYAFFYVAVRASSVLHDFKVDCRGAVIDSLSLGSTVTDWITLIDAKSDFRGCTPYMQNKGDKLEIRVTNKGDNEHIYDVYVFGVK